MLGAKILKQGVDANLGGFKFKGHLELSSNRRLAT